MLTRLAVQRADRRFLVLFYGAQYQESHDLPGRQKEITGSLVAGPQVVQRDSGGAAEAVVRVGGPVAAADGIEDRGAGPGALGNAFPGEVRDPAGPNRVTIQFY